LFEKVRDIYIFFIYFNQNLKNRLEYKEDFIFTVVTGAVLQLTNFMFLWVLFSKIPRIDGWSFWEIVFLFSMLFLSEGFVSFFFEGIWGMTNIINTGELDRMLLRPLSPLLQIASSSFGPHGLGNMFLGVYLLILAILNTDFIANASNLFFIIVFIVSAVIIRTSIIVVANCSGFWIKSSRNSFNIMMHAISEFGKYPLNFFNFKIQALITFIVPYAFISYYPALFIFRKSEDIWFYPIITPIIAVVCMLSAISIFIFSLRKYESSGH